MSDLLALIYIYSIILIKTICIYFFVFLKLFRVFILIRMLFEQLILFNQYKWPLSFIRIITNPFFQFWRKLLPKIRLSNRRLPFFEVQTLIGLNFFNKFILLIEQYLPIILQQIDIKLKNLIYTYLN